MFKRRRAIATLLLLLTLAMAACGGGDDGDSEETPGTESKGTVTVGVSGSFPENQIVAEMYAQVLENNGYTVERQTSLQNREISQPALESGEIDVKPEYLGTLLAFLDANAAPSSDPAETVKALEPLLAPKNLALLNYSPANDTNAFVVTKETADKHKLAKVSDLVPVAKDLTLGGPPECEARTFCLVGLRDVYGVNFGKVEKIGACDSATVNALDAGKVDVALLCSTQAIIAAKGWVALEDDKKLQKADNIAPLIRTEVLNEEISNLLNGVSEKITTEKITDLNAKVELDQDDPEAVAREFLESENLI